jgi:LacI family transcriptional regulator
MKQHIPKVALLIETSRGYGRSMLRGIVRYASLYGPWQFYVTPGDFAQALPAMEQWGGTGIIARIETTHVARAIIQTGLPTIALDISQNVPLDALSGTPMSEIASDSFNAAVMAAEHLLEIGMRNFAFVGEPARKWSLNRELGFIHRLEQAGYKATIYEPPKKKTNLHWEREQPHLSEWISSLPKPIGIMACNDDRGLQVLEACRAASVIVPLEVAVVGVDNDELLCELASPPLSSVALNAEAGGYRAAELLDKLMKGQVIQPQRLVVEPLYVVQRRSTESSAVDDPDIATALNTIHAFATKPITIDEIVDQLSVSRRMFEIRFRKAVGRTPHQELRRVRLLRAQQMLLETDNSIADIAMAAGFCSPAHLAHAFQKDLQKTPAQYRREHRT